MDFFLDMAWDATRWRHDNVREYLEQWAARDIDPRFAKEIAAIMEEYYRLGFTRRPEHLVQYRANTPLQYSWFNINNFNDEARQRLDRYQRISDQADAIAKKLQPNRKDAYFELVHYPVLCSALMNAKIIHADKSMRYAAEGRCSALDYANRARASATNIIRLTDRYNKGLTVGNKWNYMLSWAPGPWGAQRHQFEMPPLSDFDGLGPPRMGLSLEGGGNETLPDLSVYTKGKRFIDLFNYGKGEINWKATCGEPWVQLSLDQGVFRAQRRVWVTIDWARAPKGNENQASIDFVSNGGNKRAVVPIFNPATPRPEEVKGYVESHGYVCMEAEHYSRSHKVDGGAWEIVKGLGRSGDSVTVLPTTVPSRVDAEDMKKHSPMLEYDIHVFTPGKAQLEIQCLPTQPIHDNRGVRVAVSVDDGEPQILRGAGKSVLANVMRLVGTMDIPRVGPHTLKVWMVDPGVIVDRIILSTRNVQESYLGPPESYRGTGPRM